MDTEMLCFPHKKPPLVRGSFYPHITQPSGFKQRIINVVVDANSYIHRSEFMRQAAEVALNGLALLH